MPLLSNKSTSDMFLIPFLYVNVKSEVGQPTSLKFELERHGLETPPYC
jgi:hypothetical protein